MNAVSKTKKMAWIMFAVVSVPYLLVYFHRVAPAVVVDRLMAEFKGTGAVLGNLSAIYFYIYTLMQIPAGILADSLGPRRTITMGCCVSAAGSVFFGLAGGIFTAYVGRFLVGLGVSIIFIPILKICTEWFDPKRFAAMSGTTLLVGNSGALLAATPLALLADHIGWRAAFIIIGVVGLLAALLSFAVLRDRPADLNLPSPNSGSTVNKKYNLGQAWGGLRAVMANPASWPPFFAFMGIYGPLMAFQGTWGAAYLMQNYGVSRIQAANGLLPIALGLIIGSPAIGYISDRIDNRRIPFLCASFVYLTVWAALRYWPGGKPSLFIFPFLFFAMGFSASAFILSWAIGKEANSPRLAGSAMGFTNMGGFLGAAVMQPLFGFLLDLRWQGQSVGGARIYTLDGYHLAFTLGIAVVCMSLGSIFLAGVIQPGPKPAIGEP